MSMTQEGGLLADWELKTWLTKRSSKCRTPCLPPRRPTTDARSLSHVGTELSVYAFPRERAYKTVRALTALPAHPLVGRAQPAVVVSRTVRRSAHRIRRPSALPTPQLLAAAATAAASRARATPTAARAAAGASGPARELPDLVRVSHCI